MAEPRDGLGHLVPSAAGEKGAGGGFQLVERVAGKGAVDFGGMHRAHAKVADPQADQERGGSPELRQSRVSDGGTAQGAGISGTAEKADEAGEEA